MAFSVSWVILTYNRYEKVQRSVLHNMANAGEPWDEIVWCDNGSTDGVRLFMEGLNPDVSILNKQNLGVAKGYNRALALSSCEYVVITGCDMLMPDNWLRAFKDYVENVPKTGIACMYSGPLSWVPERARKANRGETWKRENINGREIIHAMPIGRRIISKSLLHKIGYFREDFGLYGYDDVEWGYRAERVCDEAGLLYYVIPDQIAVHLGTEGIKKADGQDESTYHAFKAKEVQDPAKHKKLNWCKQNKYPYYNPYT